MDKRTVLFIVSVGLVFLGLNLFFSYQNDREQREQLHQTEVKQQRERAQIEKIIQQKTVPLSELPLVNLFDQRNAPNPIAHGINVEGNTITLAWADKVPTTLYVNGNPQQLKTKEVVNQGPVVYAAPNFQYLEIGAVPKSGFYDVQLVSFPLGSVPTVTYGEFTDGELSIPAGRLKNNALVLFKSNDEWLVTGFYEAASNAYVDLQDIPLLSEIVRGAPSLVQQKKDEAQKYYVLENDYVQLVFSNVGGALTEINLPFESEQDPKSVVKEIGFDRDILQNHPKNALFPAHPYYRAGTSEEITPSKLGGYYPLLRRGIWNSKTVEISPQFYALNLVSEYPEMAELVYEVTEFTKDKITFQATQPHRKIIKTFSLPEPGTHAPYVFDMKMHIDGDSRGLWLTSGIPEVEIMSNNSSPQVQYRLLRRGKSVVEKLDLPKSKEIVAMSSVTPDWMVNSNGYLGIIMDPLDEIGSGFRVVAVPGNEVPTRLSLINPPYQPYPPAKYPGYQMQVPIPTRGGDLAFRVFSGPFEEHVLKTLDKTYSDPETGYNPDYIACRTFYGWFAFISKPFARFLYVVMEFFYRITHSWGISIILLTVFLRLLLYPLNAWSIKSMRRMQKLSPRIQEIQKRNKKDPKRAQMEIMGLYKQEKVNPFTGCIPILIQIPFLIAMFDLLKSSFQLRGASFIPGWIDNLTAPDVIFEWKTPIFFIGNQLHLLPILLGVVMFVQQRYFSGAPKDISKLTDQQRQQRAMGTLMTVVFTVMFYHFPSGLNLYWLSSMLLGILQQWITNRYMDKKGKVEVLPPLSKDKKIHRTS